MSAPAGPRRETVAAAAGSVSTGAAGPPVAALTMSGVRASYGRIEVLHGVDLTVPAGSVFALLGPNGAGKSTLLKVASGRVRPTAGTVDTGGILPRKRTPEALARSGLCSIPEGRGIFPNLSVRDNLRMWTYCGGVTRSEAEARAFERFPRLAERRRQLAGTLSGGEQQMLAISRALVGSPRLLLLDEISMGLAPLVVAELYELVVQIAADGVTVVVVEQFVTTALAVASRAAIMVHGRVLREGTPDEMADAALGAYLTGG
ncbi:MAG: ABC transporter ATP-binding protein [Acidimicrobiales bacterium]